MTPKTWAEKAIIWLGWVKKDYRYWETKEGCPTLPYMPPFDPLIDLNDLNLIRQEIRRRGLAFRFYSILCWNLSITSEMLATTIMEKFDNATPLQILEAAEETFEAQK